MADIINLRLARKSKDRAARQSAAEANRAVHGETRAAKSARKAEQARAERLLDGARLDHD
jgi:hypothetical protein